MSNNNPIVPLIAVALAARADLFDAKGERHETAFRLFNGFSEGCSDLVVDLYGRTLVLHNYADPPERAQSIFVKRKAICTPGCPGFAPSSSKRVTRQSLRPGAE